ncbi:MAG: hypothetical protein HYT20_02450 [Candidatus Nealsonbacteria bacterium]|nr:hypothetical protein [Candidatus Nealsonbacteria bacterium]
MVSNFESGGFLKEGKKTSTHASVVPENRFENKISEKEILEKLKLYHQTSKEKWKAIQKAGAILSEKELLKQGLISKEQLEDFETTSTGSLDREAGRDEYVFASTRPANYGEVTLEIDLEALNLDGAKVATAGDWLNFVDNENDKKYFHDSEIPASEFIKYLARFLKTLPDSEWFWDKSDPRIKELIDQGMMEKIKGNQEKIRQFYKLYPEIMFPKELPLKYVKNVKIEE